MNLNEAFHAAADQAAADARQRREHHHHGHNTAANAATFGAFLTTKLDHQADQAPAIFRKEQQ